ncbi:MAG: trigger factor [Acidobacteriota bacterium]
MSIVTAIEEAGPWRKRVTVEIPAAEVSGELDKIIREFAKHAQLPGFRPGKAPKGMIRKRFRAEIEKEAREQLLPRFWQQAEKEAELDAVLPPELVGEVDIVDGEPAVFIAEVEIRPEIALDNLEFTLPEDPTTPTEVEIDEAIEELCRTNGTWEAVDRGASRGDRVAGRIRIVTGSDAEEGDADGDDAEPEWQDFAIEVGDQQVWEELSLAVTEQAAGSTATFERGGTAGEEGEEAPEPIRYGVAIDTVEEREPHAFDDELAKKVGDFEDADALRKAVVDQLEMNKKREVQMKRQKALFEQMRERYPLEPPRGLVTQEAEIMMREQMGEMARQGIDLEQAGIDWQGLGEQMRPHAERRVHERLLLDAIGAEREVEPEDDVVNGAIAMMARQEGMAPMQMRRELEERGTLEDLVARLRRQKVLEQMLGTDDDEAADDE